MTLVVYNQVQLTELTEEINTTAKQLEEAESLEIQLNMEPPPRWTAPPWSSTPKRNWG